MEAVPARPIAENSGRTTQLGVGLLFGSLQFFVILAVSVDFIGFDGDLFVCGAVGSALEQKGVNTCLRSDSSKAIVGSTNQISEAELVAASADSELPANHTLREGSLPHRAYVAVIDEAKRRDEELVEGIDENLLRRLSIALAEVDRLGTPAEVRSLALIADGEFDRGLDQLMLAIHESEVGSSDQYRRVGDIGNLLDNSRAIGAYLRVVKLDPENAEILNSLTQLYFFEDNIADAEDANRRALAIDEADDREKLGSQFMKGVLHATRGELEIAEEVFEDSLRRSLELRDRSYLLQIEVLLTEFYVSRDEFKKFRVMVQKVLLILEEQGSKEELAAHHALLGMLNSGLEDSDSAIDSYEEAIRLYTELDELAAAANLHSLLCAIHYTRREFVAAKDACVRALPAGKLLGNAELEAIGHWQLGGVYYELKEYSAARRERVLFAERA